MSQYPSGVEGEPATKAPCLFLENWRNIAYPRLFVKHYCNIKLQKLWERRITPSMAEGLRLRGMHTPKKKRQDLILPPALTARFNVAHSHVLLVPDMQYKALLIYPLRGAKIPQDLREDIWGWDDDMHVLPLQGRDTISLTKEMWSAVWPYEEPAKARNLICAGVGDRVELWSADEWARMVYGDKPVTIEGACTQEADQKYLPK